jgi:hypothetical protein
MIEQAVKREKSEIMKTKKNSMACTNLLCSLLGLLAMLATSVEVRAQSHFVRLGDTGAGTVGHITVSGLGDGRVVTAVDDAAGNLKLTVWDVTSDGKFTRRGSIEAGKTSVFALATLGTTDAIAAVRKEDGNLRLIDWSVDSAGNLARRGDIDAGAIDRVAIAVGGPSRVVTATVATGHTKLIVWDLNNAGQFIRRGDANSADGSRAVVAALTAGEVVLAVKDASGKLDVSAWSLNQTGQLAPLTSSKGSQVTEINITTTALDRAVTASGLPDGSVEIVAWDVGANGNVAAAGSAKAGVADNIALAAIGSTKVVTALRQSDQTLKLISWQVIDTVRRLDSISAGPVGGIAAMTLGWDRVIAAVQDNAKNLKLIDFADFSVGLLHSQWGPAPTMKDVVVPSMVITPPNPTGARRFDDERMMPSQHLQVPTAPKPIERAKESAEEIFLPGKPPGFTPPPPVPAQAPKPELVFFPDIGGVDPMIAAGKDFVIVSEDHWIEFLYKTGPKAGKQLDSKAGEKTLLSSYEFFGGFFAPQNNDGSVNRNNINLHGRFPPSFDPAVTCKPTANPSLPCMNEAYDTRVIYDPYRNRFVIMSAMRGSSLKGTTSLVARRYVAIAVSKTEDPRDGFYQYATTESNYSDWPRIASAEGLLVVAHNACKGPEASDICGSDHQNVPGNAMALRPMATVYRIDDMINQEPAPRNWKIYPYQVGGGTFYPVAHHGSSAGWTYLVKPTSGLDIYRFKQPANNWIDIPLLEKDSFVLSGGAHGFTEAIHFCDGKLYMGGAVSVANRVPDISPQRWHVRGVRIPVASDVAGKVKAGPCPTTPGCLDFDFGLHALEDAPADELSYELASLAPNGTGDMLLVYGRVPVKMANPIGQEARFSVYYNDARALVRSRLIQGGSTVLKDIYCNGGQSETTPTAENYFHVYNWNDNEPCSTQEDFQDYGTAAVDPDGKSFWVAHAYADGTTNKFKMVGAKIVP